jgi:hypothetical protein
VFLHQCLIKTQVLLEKAAGRLNEGSSDKTIFFKQAFLLKMSILGDQDQSQRNSKVCNTPSSCLKVKFLGCVISKLQAKQEKIGGIIYQMIASLIIFSIYSIKLILNCLKRFEKPAFHKTCTYFVRKTSGIIKKKMQVKPAC